MVNTNAIICYCSCLEYLPIGVTKISVNSAYLIAQQRYKMLTYTLLSYITHMSFDIVGLESVELRRIHVDLIILYKLLDKNIECNVCNVFTFNSVLNTRSHAYKLVKMDVD